MRSCDAKKVSTEIWGKWGHFILIKFQRTLNLIFQPISISLFFKLFLLFIWRKEHKILFLFFFSSSSFNSVFKFNKQIFASQASRTNFIMFYVISDSIVFSRKSICKHFELFEQFSSLSHSFYWIYTKIDYFLKKILKLVSF